MARPANKKIVSPTSYYYADGRRIALVPSKRLLAIDKNALGSAGLDLKVRAAVEKHAKDVTKDLKLVERSALENNGDIEQVLGAAGALQPVFDVAGATLIALPEVRVEGVSSREKQSFDAWLTQHKDQAIVQRQSEGRFTIRPASGYGGDALRIANSLAEQFQPALAQPRFVRITDKPSVTRHE